MSITADRKAELIKSYGNKSGDTGSPEVQVAILSERIANLTDSNDQANWLKVAVRADGGFSVTNGRTGLSKSYTAR